MYYGAYHYAILAYLCLNIRFRYDTTYEGLLEHVYIRFCNHIFISDVVTDFMFGVTTVYS